MRKKKVGISTLWIFNIINFLIMLISRISVTVLNLPPNAPGISNLTDYL